MIQILRSVWVLTLSFSPLPTPNFIRSEAILCQSLDRYSRGARRIICFVWLLRMYLTNRKPYSHKKTGVQERMRETLATDTPTVERIAVPRLRYSLSSNSNSCIVDWALLQNQTLEYRRQSRVPTKFWNTDWQQALEKMRPCYMNNKNMIQNIVRPYSSCLPTSVKSSVKLCHSHADIVAKVECILDYVLSP